LNKLIANFEFELPFFLLINVPAKDNLEFKTKVGDYNANVILIRDEDWRSQFKGERDWSNGITKINVSISKDERIAPPALKITPEGNRSYEDRYPYFEERTPEFQRVALEVVNKIIRYFKYKLHNPTIYELGNFNHGLLNPEWSDETGQIIKTGVVHSVMSPIPGMGPNKLSSIRLSPENYPDLQKALDHTIDAELYEDLLSDAQAAFYQQNLRRSILEMAIASELFVKSFFFGRSYYSSMAFDYLEDKGRKISVTEFIHNVAKRAFGVSFKEENPESFSNIDYLFRARNKIAHRGEISYRDDSGCLIVVNEMIVQEWWYSIQELITWLTNQDVSTR
jgi:hypothetical protein